jgi:hypothetical protein
MPAKLQGGPLNKYLDFFKSFFGWRDCAPLFFSHDTKMTEEGKEKPKAGRFTTAIQL